MIGVWQSGGIMYRYNNDVKKPGGFKRGHFVPYVVISNKFVSSELSVAGL